MIIRVTRTFGSFPISAVVNYYKSVTQKHKFFQRNHAYSFGKVASHKYKASFLSKINEEKTCK